MVRENSLLFFLFLSYKILVSGIIKFKNYEDQSNHDSPNG